MKQLFSSFIYSRRGCGILHILILLSLFLVINQFPIDTFLIPFLNQGSYLKIQFWISCFSCSISCWSFPLEKKKGRYFTNHFFPAGIYTLI